MSYGKAIAKQRTDYNLYEGMQLIGFPIRVLLRGKTIVEGEQWYGEAGAGKLLKRKPGTFI